VSNPEGRQAEEQPMTTTVELEALPSLVASQVIDRSSR
jgi:hypothetical protein